jgi:hypothetical protein
MVALVVLLADKICAKGLKLLGFDRTFHQSKASCSLNESQFKSFFGSEPVVYAQIWEDLQMTEIEKAHINPCTATINHFLMASKKRLLRKNPLLLLIVLLFLMIKKSIPDLPTIPTANPVGKDQSLNSFSSMMSKKADTRQ